MCIVTKFLFNIYIIDSDDIIKLFYLIVAFLIIK